MSGSWLLQVRGLIAPLLDDWSGDLFRIDSLVNADLLGNLDTVGLLDQSGDQHRLHLTVLLGLQVALLGGNVLQQSSGLRPAVLLARCHHAVAGGADLLGDLLAGRVGSCLLDDFLLESTLLHRPLLALLADGDERVGVLGQDVVNIGSEVSARQGRGSNVGVSNLAAPSELNVGDGNCHFLAFLLNNHLTLGLVVPRLTDCLVMSVTHSLSLANCIVIAGLCQGLVTNFYVLLKHHGFVGDVTILIKTRLALLLLGGNVVGDEGVVALLTEGVLALHLLLVDGLLHLHQLLDAPHVLLLLLGGLLLLPGVQLGLIRVFVPIRVGAGVRSHGVSELVEESSVVTAASNLSRHRVPIVSLLLLLSVLVVVVVVVVLLLLLSLLEILLLLEVAVGLLVVVVKLILLFVVELLGLLGLNVPHGAGLRPLIV